MMQQEQFTVDQIKRFDEIADKAIQQFNALVALIPENNWQLSSDKNGYKIHLRADKETGLNIARGEGFFPYSIDQIMEVLNKVDNAETYDESCEQAKVVSIIRDDLRINYYKLKDMFLIVSGRDFVILQKRKRVGNKLWVIGKSIELFSIPPVKGKVRGDLIFGGWLLEEKDGGTQAIYLTQGDPKGNIPTKAVNFVSSAQGEVVEKFKKFMDKKYGKT